MLLEVENLQMQIRLRTATVRAVDGVSLTLSAGETLGLVGESGCGKSMTAMSIMRLLPPGGEITGGRVRLNDKNLLALPGSQMRQVRGDEIAMVFQDPMTSLNPTKTVGDQIAEPLQIHRHQSRSDAMQRAVDMLGLVGMPKPAERLKDYPHQLSGGLRQRAMIAMALACEPKLLIADEPTTALDVTIQDQILTLLGRLTTELGMGLLLITHDMGVIASRSDRVMVMYAGRIVESGATGTLFRSARHPYSRALLASIPDLKTDKTKALASIPGLPPDLTHPPPACRFAARCKYAQQRCEQEDPPLGGDDPEHQFACFYPVQPTAGPGGAVPAARPGSPGAVVSGAPRPADGEDRDALLVVEHAVKEFPVTKGILQRKASSVKAVSDVSVEVGRGQTFGLVGESGCGKSTLGRLIIGLERPDSGTIRFDGADLSRLRGPTLRRQRQHFQLMFQDPYSSLDPRMRVGSILREPLIAQDVGSRKDRERRIRELLGEVGLGASAADLYPHEFSGGQRQRIGLARALILEPKLIVADEPVSALDVSIQAQILNLMKRLQSERDLAYVLISHDLSVVRYLADRIGVMYLGKLVETGTAAEVYERPAHPYTAGLLRSVPEPDPAKARKDGEAISGELPSSVTPPSGCRFRTRCPRAQEICAEQEPPMRSFQVASHQAACHFPLQAPEIDSGSAGPASAPASMAVRQDPPP